LGDHRQKKSLLWSVFQILKPDYQRLVENFMGNQIVIKVIFNLIYGANLKANIP